MKIFDIIEGSGHQMSICIHLHLATTSLDEVENFHFPKNNFPFCSDFLANQPFSDF